MQTLTGHTSVRNISFSPDGSTLAAVTGDFRDGTVLLWDVNTGKLKTFPVSRSIYSVAFSPDGNTLAIGGNWRTDIWNANTGAPIHTFSKISCRIESVAFSPDGNTLAGGGSDGIVRLWDIKTGTKKQIPTGNFGDMRVAFSPDGNTLATVSDIGGAVLLWDVNTGKPLREFTADGSGLSRIYSMAFSPDGNTLATGSGDYDHIEGSFGTVTLWDVNTRETLQTLTGHTHEVTSISFSPDGSTIATGSRDGAVLLWELTPAVDSAAAAAPAARAQVKTALLANYPNPFNPETWIPYQLSKPADVTLTISAVDGQVVRQLALGHQSAGIYQSRSHAAYWDGRNALGEPVASGVYFYTLTAGEFTATRKLLIRK